MPVDVRWLAPGRIVLHHFSGTVTLEDTTRASLEGPALANTGTPPVHMIANLLDVTHYPLSVHQLEAAIRVNPRLEQLGWVVIIIRHNPVLRFVATILTQIRYSKLHVTIFEDTTAALRFLLERDPGLSEYITPNGELITPPPDA